MREVEMKRIDLLFLVMALSGHAWAGPLEDAGAAYSRGDYATALTLVRPLAEQGNASAQNNLGLMYETGRGVPQDYKAAVKWLGLAADQGDTNAQLNLGLKYDNGLGVPQDHVQAYKWFSLAASRNPMAVKARDTLTAKMTPAQIAEAQKLAREWKLKK
jgi:TPR repeat protein